MLSPPPTLHKVCPRCGAAAGIDVPACYSCGRVYRTTAPVPRPPLRVTTPLWIRQAFLPVLAIVVLMGVSLLWSLATTFSEVQPAPPPPRAAGYMAHRDEVEYGMTTAAVKAICGEPERTQQQEHANPGGKPERTDYLYYDGCWQLIFEKDSLKEINSY